MESEAVSTLQVDSTGRVMATIPEGLVRVHKGKLHCARVKQCDLHYSGSITIDQDLLEAAGMIPMEFVHIWNKNNGARIETYTIPGPRGSGMICINGAASRNFAFNDEVIICSYRFVNPIDVTKHEQRIVVIKDNDNVVGRVFKYGLTRDPHPSTCAKNPYIFKEEDVKFHYKDIGGVQRLVLDELVELT